jgi:outer membrane protein assembly factor BamB
MRHLLRPIAAGTLATLLAVTLATPAHAAAPAWNQDGYGPGNTGHNPAETVIKAATVDELTYKWSVQLTHDADDECGTAQVLPVVAGGRAFVADATGIHAYTAGTGAPLWDRAYAAPDEEVATELALVGTTLIATVARCAFNTGTVVYALKAATGAKIWSNTLAVDATQLVVDKGIAAVGGIDDYDLVQPPQVVAFRVSDGKKRWTRTNVTMGEGVSANGKLLLRRTDVAGTVAVDITNNAQLWKSTKSWTPKAANPKNDRFYVSDNIGTLIALKTSGAVVWTVKNAGTGIASYDPAKGKKLWSKTQTGYAGRPIIAGGLLYVAVSQNPPAILNPANGAPVANSVQNQYAYDHVVVVSGLLFFYDSASLLVYGT